MFGLEDFIINKITHLVKSHKYNNELNNSIKKSIYYCNSEKAIFILPEWMDIEFFYKPLINKLKNKHTIVYYNLPSRLLSDNIKLTVYLFKKIVNNIKLTFNKLQKNGCKSYCVIGNSTSTALALMISNSDERCKKVILNLTGNSLAEGLWNSKNTGAISIKNKLINKGITLAKLKSHFSLMSYEKNSSNLNKKDILIFLSKNDKMIPYKNGIKLLKLLNKDSIKYELVINRFLGHYISGLRNILFSSKIQKFLDHW